MSSTATTTGANRSLFDRLPRLADLVPFMPLADGLPTPVEQVANGLWVQRDDLTSSVYGGNKVRKLEFTLPVAARRGGPVVTAGAVGSHHVLATAIHARRLGLDVASVRFPQPSSEEVSATAAEVAEVAGMGSDHLDVPSSYLMPLGLAALLGRSVGRAWLDRASSSPTLLWPGASTPLGTLGHVSAGLELVAAFAATDQDEPDDVVCALGSGGTAAGLAVGIALGGWRRARVVGVRAADRIVTNHVYLAPLVGGTLALLALGGAAPVRPRLTIDGRWLGRGYGHPTTAGEAATEQAAALGLTVEPTYTAKALAAALALAEPGRRVVFVQTYAGPR